MIDHIGRSHVAMMAGWVMLGEVISKVRGCSLPVDSELSLLDAISDPVEAHVHGSGSSEFASLVGNLMCSCVVSGERCWLLWMSHFVEDGADDSAFFGIEEQEGTKFSFSCRGHDMFDDG